MSFRFGARGESAASVAHKPFVILAVLAPNCFVAQEADVDTVHLVGAALVVGGSVDAEQHGGLGVGGAVAHELDGLKVGGIGLEEYLHEVALSWHFASPVGPAMYLIIGTRWKPCNHRLDARLGFCPRRSRRVAMAHLANPVQDPNRKSTTRGCEHYRGHTPPRNGAPRTARASPERSRTRSRSASRRGVRNTAQRQHDTPDRIAMAAAYPGHSSSSSDCPV